jgi:hypothetical protein
MLLRHTFFASGRRKEEIRKGYVIPTTPAGLERCVRTAKAMSSCRFGHACLKGKVLSGGKTKILQSVLLCRKEEEKGVVQ